MNQRKKLDNLLSKIKGHHYVAATLILVIIFFHLLPLIEETTVVLLLLSLALYLLRDLGRPLVDLLDQPVRAAFVKVGRNLGLLKTEAQLLEEKIIQAYEDSLELDIELENAHRAMQNLLDEINDLQDEIRARRKLQDRFDSGELQIVSWNFYLKFRVLQQIERDVTAAIESQDNNQNQD